MASVCIDITSNTTICKSIIFMQKVANLQIISLCSILFFICWFIITVNAYLKIGKEQLKCCFLMTKLLELLKPLRVPWHLRRYSFRFFLKCFWWISCRRSIPLCSLIFRIMLLPPWVLPVSFPAWSILFTPSLERVSPLFYAIILAQEKKNRPQKLYFQRLSLVLP